VYEVCRDCGTPCATIRDLIQHFKLCHSDLATKVVGSAKKTDVDEEKGHLCSNCGKMMPSIRALIDHIKTCSIDEDNENFLRLSLL
jgi:hypothetical protein